MSTTLPLDVIRVLLGVVLVGNVGLGVLVFSRGPRQLANRVFLLFALSAAAWVGGILIMFLSRENALATLGLRFAFVGGALVAWALLHFSILFPKPFPDVRLLRLGSALDKASALLFSVLAVLSIVTPLVVQQVTVSDTERMSVYGVAYVAYAVFVFLALVCSAGLFIRRLLLARELERVQLSYVLFGIFASMVIGFFANVIIPAITGSSSFSFIGPLGTSVALIAIAYAIVRHHLLDIRVISIEVLTGLVLLVLTVELFLSEGTAQFLWRVFVVVVVAVFGYSVIGGTLREFAAKARAEALAKQLEVANERLREIDAAKTEFVSLTSHQIRTPLTVMKGFLSMVFEGRYGAVPETLKSVLQKTYDANERLVKLIADLLNISRIESGKLIFEKEPTDLAALTKSVVDELSQTAQAKRLALTFEASPGLPQVSLDATRFRQVVLNLIDNAIKYTEQGRVAVRVVSNKKAVVLSVEDTGRGMTEEDAQHIFGKFERGIEVPRVDVEGVGLGLYLARKIVEAHGGAISASTAGPGKGSTFTVTLPL